MQWINELQGQGKGKKCLIIGGGLSVREFNFKDLPEGFIRICVNNAFPDSCRVDYLVYNDANFVRLLKRLVLPNYLKVIGEASNPCERTNYYFRNELIGCKPQDNTGLRAIQIAKNIFQFEEIYLIGFDFHTREIDGKKQSHFYGDEFGDHKKYPTEQHIQDHFNLLNKMIGQFEAVKDITNIYNCYRESSLKLFPYKEIKGENT